MAFVKMTYFSLLQNQWKDSGKYPKCCCLFLFLLAVHSAVLLYSSSLYVHFV